VPETPANLRRVDDLWRYFTSIIGVLLVAGGGWIFVEITGRVSALESGQERATMRYSQQDKELALLNQKIDLLLKDRGIAPPGPK